MLFSHSEKEQVALLIDVGNSVVTSSLVAFDGENIPKFLCSYATPFVISERPDASRLIESLMATLDAQMTVMMKNCFNHKYWQGKRNKINSALVSFSSPWFVFKTKHILITNEKDFIISESFLNEVTNKEETLFKTELSNNTEDQFEIIEKSLIHTKINGYSLNSIIGKKTKNLEAFLCLSALDKGILERVFNTVSRYSHIPNQNILVHTFPLVSFAVVRDNFETSGEFIVMDVTGDVTDLTLVQNSVIMQTVSMPSGRNFLIRQICRTFDVSAEIAESMLHMFNTDRMEDDGKLKMEELLTLVEKEWAIYFENALLELSPTLSLPTNVYLMSESDVAKIYQEFLKLQKLDATSMFRKNIKVKIIDENALATFIENQSTSKIDEFSGVLALFYKKLINTR